MKTSTHIFFLQLREQFQLAPLMRLPPAWTKATAVFAKLTESEHGALPGRISNAHHYADNRAAGDAAAKLAFKSASIRPEISSKSLGRDWSESFHRRKRCDSRRRDLRS